MLSTQLHAATASRDSKDAQIVTLCNDSDAAMAQCKALAASVTDLTEKAQRVTMLDARSTELEKLLMEAATARELLGREVAARDEEVHACQQRIHMLQEEAHHHRQQVHTAHADASSLQFKLEDASSSLATAQASEARLRERVEEMQEKAATLAAQVHNSLRKGTRRVVYAHPRAPTMPSLPPLTACSPLAGSGG